MRSILIFLTLFSFSIQAQVNLKDSAVNVPLLGVNYGIYSPAGDLAERFGNSSSIGAEFLYKTKGNFIIGADWNYLFGTNVKEQGLFDSLVSNTGAMIDKAGFPAEIRLYERGYLFSVKGGKVIPVLSPNKNSGLLFMAGIGLLQHKIRIEDVNNSVPQVEGDYKKGYDRLTSGLSLSQFLGYLYLGNKRLINFYAGLEFIEAFTKSRRSYDFDKMQQDTQKRNDILLGIKAGWILPLYKKAPKEFYYY